MLIPLTDPEHPLAKQMLRLIGDHSHRPATVDPQTIAAAPVAVEAGTDDIWTRRGRTLRARLETQREQPVLTPARVL